METDSSMLALKGACLPKRGRKPTCRAAMVSFFMQRPMVVSHTGRSCGQQCLQAHIRWLVQVAAVRGLLTTEEVFWAGFRA